MKFICDKCKTRYTISDEKVRGKVLKIRCKNCGNVIEVREPQVSPERAPRSKKPSTQGALRARSRHGSTARKRPTGQTKPTATASRPPSERLATPAVPWPHTDPALRRAAAAAAEDDPKTVIAAMPDDVLREARQRAGQRAPSAPVSSRSATAEPADAMDEDASWYLGDDRGEYGPMTFTELAARVKRGEPGHNAEVWQEGMDDWVPLAEVPALQPYLRKAPPPRPAQPLPPSPYQKRPERDAAPADRVPVGGAAHRPLVAKVTTRTAEMDTPLYKEPAVAPVMDLGRPLMPARDESGLGLDADALVSPAITPAPASSPSGLVPAQPAHVSLGKSSDLDTLLAEQKRARRPILFISLAAVLIAGAAVVLVVYLISSGSSTKKREEQGDQKVAQREGVKDLSMAMDPVAVMQIDPMAAMQGGDVSEVTQELPELEIDISTGMTVRRRRSGKKHMAAREPMGTAMESGGGRLPFLSKPMFTGLRGFGSSSVSGGGVSGSGGRPGNLGQVVRRYYSRLKRCYEKAARLNTRLRNPKLRISIKISSGGRAQSVYISPSRYQSDTLGICVRQAIMQWRWPSYSNTYSYSFYARFQAG